MTTNLFLSRICARAEETPDATFAWVHDGAGYQTLTQQDVIEEAWGFAAWLRSRGVAPGAVVFLILRHCPELYPTYLGAMLAGAVPSFLPFPNPKQDPKLYWESHRRVFERTGARCVVTYSGLVREVTTVAKRLDLEVFDVAGLERLGLAEHVREFQGDDDIALLQHSSGTTGLKKGVALSYRAIREQIEAYVTVLDPESKLADARIASWLPLYHDMGLIACFLLPAYLGTPIVSLDAFTWANHPALLLEAIEQFKATHAWLPNFAFQHLVRVTPRSANYDLSSLQVLINCSEPVKAESLDLFLDRFADAGVRRETLKACYAMAEAVFAVAQSPLEGAPRIVEIDAVNLAASRRAVAPRDDSRPVLRAVSNGRPIPGMKVRITRNGKPTGERDVGEICIQAPYLFSGYLGDPDSTAQAFDDGWYRTGDLGFVLDDEVFVTGRIKDLLIINGINYFAHDLEATVSGVEGVKAGRCAALGVYNDAVGSEQIVIVAERADGARPDGDPITVQHINQALWGRFGVGAGDIRLVEPGWVIKTTSGKISRTENLVKYQRLRDRTVERTGTP
jgi:fatty-acyl-CoA synthase